VTSVCLYFQVHQPYRLRPNYHFFDIGNNHDYEDDGLNQMILERVASRCYIPTCTNLLNQIKKHAGKFRVAFSISGTALEQCERYAPNVIGLFQDLVNTGCVELLSETYYHSLASVYSPSEFKAQVDMHRDKIKSLFNVTPVSFRNTELVYDSTIAKMIEKMGFKSMIVEGSENLLGWRSPNNVYMPDSCYKLNLLTRNYKLSDDIAFRFCRTDWSEYPLTSTKYAKWLTKQPDADLINLCMDFETFGEHQQEQTGILKFINDFSDSVLKHDNLRFVTPSDVPGLHEPVGKLKSYETNSWADKERNLSAWQGNCLQDSAAEQAYSFEKAVKATGDATLLHDWRCLLSSDHYYYMAQKKSTDGQVHQYFSPFATPHDAYIVLSNALNDIEFRIENR
jgi:alpha-amylase